MSLLVDSIKTFGTGALGAVSAKWLARAANAAPAASHNLDKVVKYLSRFYFLKQQLGVFKPMHDRNFQFAIAQLDGGLLDGFIHATHAGIFDFAQGVDALFTRDATDNRLGDAASCAENNACTTAHTKWHIGGLVVNLVKTYAHLFNHG
ncbi:hypothetical protein DSECCO2_630940 [anaerobic digester metagenome]